MKPTYNLLDRALVLIVVTTVFLTLSLPAARAQDQEPADRFQLEFLKVDFSTNNPNYYHSSEMSYYVYDLTNSLVSATQAWVMAPYHIEQYHEDWYTNTYSWGIDPGTGNPTNRVGNFTWHYVTWTNFTDEMNPVVVPEKTSNVTATVTSFSDVAVNPTGSCG